MKFRSWVDLSSSNLSNCNDEFNTLKKIGLSTEQY